MIAMSQLLPLEGALKNLKQEIAPDRKREYLTREDALILLRKWTGQDFGYDTKKWEDWITENGPTIKAIRTSG